MDKVEHTHCCYCRRRFSDNLKRTVEHFIPSSRSGKNSALNKLQCCEECNMWKADRMPDFWMKQVLHFQKLRKKYKTYQNSDYAQIVGSIKHWLKFFKDKEISDYKSKTRD